MNILTVSQTVQSFEDTVDSMAGWGSALSPSRPRSADPGPRGLDSLVERMNKVNLGTNTSDPTTSLRSTPVDDGQGSLPWSTEVWSLNVEMSIEQPINLLCCRTPQVHETHLPPSSIATY
jgi:hypothetical protein